MTTLMFLLFAYSLVNTLYSLGNNNIYTSFIVFCCALNFIIFWIYLEKEMIK